MYHEKMKLKIGKINKFKVIRKLLLTIETTNFFFANKKREFRVITEMFAEILGKITTQITMDEKNRTLSQYIPIKTNQFGIQTIEIFTLRPRPPKLQFLKIKNKNKKLKKNPQLHIH